MPERHDDLVTMLRALGDEVPAPEPGGPDPVDLALNRIAEARPSGPAHRVVDGAGRRIAALTSAHRSRAHVERASRWLPVGRRPRWHPVLAVVVAAAVSVVVALPGPRAAMARLLGIGGVRMVVTGEVPATLPHAFDLGEPIAVDRALEEAPPALASAASGDPVAAFAGRPPGGVSLVWPASEHLPEIDAPGPTGVGLIVTAFPGDIGTPVMRKDIGPGTRLEAVTVAGYPGYWVSGAPHEVAMAAPSGEVLPDTVRLAGNTLLWTVGTTTYRLESALDRAGALEVAERVTPRA